MPFDGDPFLMTNTESANSRSGLRTHPSWTALGLFFGVLVLVFSPAGLDQFELPKQLVLLVGLPIMAAAVLTADCRSSRHVDWKLVALVVAFAAWSSVAPLHRAENTGLHAFGAMETALAAALVGVSIAVRRNANLQGENQLLRLFALPTIVVATFAVAQSSGLDPLHYFLNLESTRPGRWATLTTLGNPSWTAELISSCFPIVVMALWCGRKPTTRPMSILGIATLIVVFGTAVTGSRGSLIGLAVGTGVVLVVIPSTLSAGRRALFAALAAFVVAGFAVLIGWATGADRWREIEPVTGRLSLWAAGSALIREAPVSGWGLRHTVLVLPEGLRTVAATIDPDLKKFLPTMLVDRLDNDWLQVALERGIPAALLLAALWFRAIMAAARRASEDGSPLDAAAAASLTVLAVCALLSAPLHTPSTAALFWIFIGLAAVGPASKPHEQTSRSKWRRLRLPAITLCVLAAAAGITLAFRATALNRLAGDGHRLLVAGQAARAAAQLQAPLQSMPWLTAASIDRARALVACDRAAEALVVVDDGQRWAASQWFWVVKAEGLHQLGFEAEAQQTLDDGLDVLPCSPLLLEASAALSGRELRTGNKQQRSELDQLN